MSMHEMEALVECSVAVVAAAQPVPADARDLCYTLYELQDQFDCGYTVLRVQDELERLGYLYLLPPGQLPEAERAEVAALNGEEGFIGGDPQIFFDAGAGRACVTAGSPVWEALCRMGRFTGADAAPVRLMPVLEVAGRIAELAAAQGDELAAQTLGLWYALYPAFLAMDWDGESQALSPPDLALRDRLATPQALAFAAGWNLLPNPGALDGLAEFDPIERQWLEPYAARAARQKADAVQAADLVKTIEEGRFSEALALAAALPEESDRAYYRALASLSYHQARLRSGETQPPPEGLLSLAETERTFASLLGSRPDQDYLCQIDRFLCLVLLGECRQGFDALASAFLPQLEQLRREEDDDWQRRYGEAAVAVLFYRILYENVPAPAPEKQRLLQTRAGDMLMPDEAEKRFDALAQERPDQAWACRYYAGLCRMMQGDANGALEALREADRLHPGDAEVQQALEQAAGLLQDAEQSSLV